MKGEILILILSASSTVLVSIVGFFLKDLISQFKNLQGELYKITRELNNVNFQMGAATKSIEILEEKIGSMEHDFNEIQRQVAVIETEINFKSGKN